MPSPSRPAPRRRLAAALVLSLVGVAGVLAPVAHAQEVMRLTVSGGPGMFGGEMSRPAMTPRELDGYAQILGFDEAQHEAAKELLAGYTTEFEKASREYGEKMRQIADEFRETRDDEVWEQMGPVNEKFSKRAKELEATLLSDLKSLCTDKQTDQWPRFERARRRDRTIDRGSVAGESVDLFRIVKGLELDAKVQADVTQQLDAYDIELDKALIERNRIMDERTSSFRPGRAQTFDFESFQKRMADIRAAGIKVRDVNQRYARAIEGLLPDDLRARFQLEVKRASFPMVYRQSKTERAFDAALKFDDLDPKQREAIVALRDGYETEIASLNDKWAAAIAEEEQDAAGGGAISGSAGMLVVSFGDDDSNKPSGQARKARRDADKKALQSLEALLTEEQKERLPKGGDDFRAAPGAFVVPGR